ncbi:MAG: arylesterase [Gemmatimonadales bacterium]|nr:MAG: arylesterase [Gemmatimonadales bacterium]
MPRSTSTLPPPPVKDLRMSSRTMRTLMVLLLPAILTVAAGCGDGSTSDSVPQAPGAGADSPHPEAGVSDTGSTGDGAVVRREGLEGSTRAGATDAAAPAAGAENSTRDAARVIFLGTSLTEGYGLDHPDTEAWPHRIAHRALEAGITGIEVVNAGLAGETSAAGARRIGWILRAEPDLLVVELGANDGLRGVPVSEMEANLERLLDEIASTAPGTSVALVRMEAPPNMGDEYTADFREAFERVARSRDVPLLSFLLDGVAGDPSLNLSDGIHPTAEGHRRMADNVWDELRPLLERVARSAPSHGASPGDGGMT